MFTDLISVDELTPILDRVVLLDCRSRLGDEAWGPAQFIEGHIPGAQHADMDKDLAAPPGERGRHPLPAQEIWIQRIRDWGISNESQVVVYDDASGAFAARAWWMLRWVGHAGVAVLDGGMQQWSGPLQSGPTPARQPSSFTAAKSLTRTIDVEALLDGTTRTLIDAPGLRSDQPMSRIAFRAASFKPGSRSCTSRQIREARRKRLMSFPIMRAY